MNAPIEVVIHRAARAGRSRLAFLVRSLLVVISTHILAFASCREADRQYAPNGQLISLSEFKKDREGKHISHGRYAAWHLNGVKRLDGRYLDGELDGRWSSWHDNGSLWQIIYYERGKPRGTSTFWLPDGTKSWEIDYGKGDADPTCSAWYPHGRKQWEGTGRFVRGRWVGTSTWWDETGREMAPPDGKPWPGAPDPTPVAEAPIPMPQSRRWKLGYDRQSSLIGPRGVGSVRAGGKDSI